MELKWQEMRLKERLRSSNRCDFFMAISGDL